MPDREHRDELASLHALGVLTDAERAEVAQLAAGDAAYAADIRALEGVVAALGGSVPQVDPPAALRARVLASITGSVPAAAPSNVTPIRRAERAKPSPMIPWLAAAASLVAAAALGLWSWQLQDRLREMDARLNEAEHEVVTVRQTLGRAENQARLLKAQAQVFLAPDVKLVNLAGQPVAPGASARAYWSRRSGMVFAAASLPPLPANKVYQVWVLAEAQPPISAGLIRPDDQGAAYETFKTPQDIPTPKIVAVTIEPEGGVPQPTGDKVLVGLTGL